MQIQMNGFHRLLANSRPKVDKSAWQARRQMLSDEISIKRTSPVETTISPEARDMWKKMQEDSQKQDTQQPQTEQQEWDTEQTQRNEEYDELMRLVYSWGRNVSNLNKSFETEEHKDALTRKQEALQEFTRMKALEQSEERRREQEALKSSEQSSMQQEEINKKNSELFMMLESFDKMEEDDEKRNDIEKKENDNGIQKEEEAVNNYKQNDIVQNGEWLGVSAVKKEMHLYDAIDEIYQCGLNQLANIKDAEIKILEETKDIEQMAASDEYTAREKEDIVFGFCSSVGSEYFFRWISERQWGLREVANASDVRTEHIGSQHLGAAKEQQEAKQAAAAENTINQNWQEMYSSYGRQLAKIVQEKIDERNDITNPERQEEPEKEEENDKNIIDTACNDSKENTEDKKI